MDLSELDVNKCAALAQQIIRARLDVTESPSPTPDKYKCTRAKRQRQKQLDGEEIAQLVARYRAGATVYELADQFGCHRTTVSECLRSRSVRMRLTPLSEEQILEAVRLYESGLSLVKVGNRVGANAETVRQRLREHGVRLRGSHERQTTTECGGDAQL